MKSLPIYINERFSTNKDEIMKYYPTSHNELVNIILDHFNNGVGNLNDIDVSKLDEEAFYRLFHDLRDEIKKNNITEINISDWNLKELYCNENKNRGMFEQCETLETVILPDCLEVIGDFAFYGCIKLDNIIIPDSVTSISDGAFYNCSSLRSVNIPKLVTLIGREVFKACSMLTSIIIPNSVKSISIYAFDNCNKLTITVPNEDVKKLVEGTRFKGKIEIK